MKNPCDFSVVSLDSVWEAGFSVVTRYLLVCSSRNGVSEICTDVSWISSRRWHLESFYRQHPCPKNEINESQDPSEEGQINTHSIWWQTQKPVWRCGDENGRKIYSPIIGKETCSFLTIMGGLPPGAGSEKLGKILGLTCLSWKVWEHSRQVKCKYWSPRDGVRHCACVWINPSSLFRRLSCLTLFEEYAYHLWSNIWPSVQPVFLSFLTEPMFIHFSVSLPRSVLCQQDWKLDEKLSKL